MSRALTKYEIEYIIARVVQNSQYATDEAKDDPGENLTKGESLHIMKYLTRLKMNCLSANKI